MDFPHPLLVVLLNDLCIGNEAKRIDGKVELVPLYRQGPALDFARHVAESGKL